MRLERLRRRQFVDDRAQYSLDTQSTFGTDLQMPVFRKTEGRSNLLRSLCWRRMREINLVDDGDEREVRLERDVEDRKRLRLDPFCKGAQLLCRYQ